ncbi:helix-turn-helix transcriptional regulator [Streptomyces sp. NPDC001941]|uniref:helix-turn-helix domain-containing protein n=1 Tax=Streptomyces sp. NPDC001941 TaxID=3154659 RepID=UPI003327C287
MSSNDKQDTTPVDLQGLRNRIFGAQQRRLREAARVSLQALATEVGYTADYLRKIESGARRARPEYITQVDAFLNTGGVLAICNQELMQADSTQWWIDEYLEEEKKAQRIDRYDPIAVPGMLQTEAYAWAILQQHYPPLDDDALAERVRKRLDRQQLLTRLPMASFTFVIEECVLRRRVGGAAATRDQLNQILRLSELRNVSVQIMDSTTAKAGLFHAFILLETDVGRRIGYTETEVGSQWVTDVSDVNRLEGRYSKIRGHALNEEASVELIRKLIRDLGDS